MTECKTRQTTFWVVKLGRRWIEKPPREAFRHSINKYLLNTYYVLKLGIQQ